MTPQHRKTIYQLLLTMKILESNAGKGLCQCLLEIYLRHRELPAMQLREFPEIAKYDRDQYHWFDNDQQRIDALQGAIEEVSEEIKRGQQQNHEAYTQAQKDMLKAGPTTEAIEKIIRDIIKKSRSPHRIREDEIVYEFLPLMEQQPVSTGERLDVKDFFKQDVLSRGCLEEEEFDEADSVGTYDGEYEMLEKYAAQEVEAAKSKWIPVSEKPKFNGEYICAVDLEDGDESLVVGSLEYHIDSDEWTDLVTGATRKCILYQELPPAPEKGEYNGK